MRVLKVKVISLPYIIQVLYVLCFTRPRNQVSVYRTIGPLVMNKHNYLNYHQILSNTHFICFSFNLQEIDVRLSNSAS